MSKDIICKRAKIRTNNIKNNTKMFNFVYTKCLYFKRRHKRTQSKLAKKFLNIQTKYGSSGS